MTRIASLEWRHAATDIYDRVTMLGVSPDDRYAVFASSQRPNVFRVIDLARGAVVAKHDAPGASVQWAAAGVLAFATVRDEMLAIELRPVGGGEAIGRVTSGKRERMAGSAVFAMNDDARFGYIRVEPIRSIWSVAMGASAPGGSPHRAATPDIQLGSIPIRFRGATYGRSVERSSWFSLAPGGSHLLIENQADVNKPVDHYVVDLSRGTVAETNQRRVGFDPLCPLPRWIGPRLVLWGDAPRDYDGTRLWITDVSAEGVVTEALVPRTGAMSEDARALASLQYAALDRTHRRLYTRNGSVVTVVARALHREPGAVWPRDPSRVVWIDDGVFARFGVPAPTQFAYRSDPRAEASIPIEDPKPFFGYPERLRISPCGTWLFLCSDSDVCWVPVNAIKALA